MPAHLKFRAFGANLPSARLLMEPVSAAWDVDTPDTDAAGKGGRPPPILGLPGNLSSSHDFSVFSLPPKEMSWFLESQQNEECMFHHLLCSRFHVFPTVPSHF